MELQTIRLPISKWKQPPNPQSSHLISQLVLSLPKPNYVLFGSLSSASISHSKPPSSIAWAMEIASFPHLTLYNSCQHRSQNEWFQTRRLDCGYFASPSNRFEMKINSHASLFSLRDLCRFVLAYIAHHPPPSSLPSGHTGHLAFCHICRPQIFIAQFGPERSLHSRSYFPAALPMVALFSSWHFPIWLPSWYFTHNIF